MENETRNSATTTREKNNIHRASEGKKRMKSEWELRRAFARWREGNEEIIITILTAYEISFSTSEESRVLTPASIFLFHPTAFFSIFQNTQQTVCVSSSESCRELSANFEPPRKTARNVKCVQSAEEDGIFWCVLEFILSSSFFFLVCDVGKSELKIFRSFLEIFACDASHSDIEESRELSRASTQMRNIFCHDYTWNWVTLTLTIASQHSSSICTYAWIIKRTSCDDDTHRREKSTPDKKMETLKKMNACLECGSAHSEWNYMFSGTRGVHETISSSAAHLSKVARTALSNRQRNSTSRASRSCMEYEKTWRN